jgi:hypothetical protein
MINGEIQNVLKFFNLVSSKNLAVMAMRMYKFAINLMLT